MPLGSVVVVIIGAIAVVPMVIVNALVSLPALLVAFTVKLNVPVVVGVPDIVPLVERVNPVGRLPFAIAQFMGVVPVAVRVLLYAVPVMPSGSVVVVMVGGIITAFIVMDKAFVSFPALFVALAVKLNVPAVVGVPDIIPVAESDKPVGKLPTDTVQVMGAVPVAVSG